MKEEGKYKLNYLEGPEGLGARQSYLLIVQK
jgi:hypothetical protein